MINNVNRTALHPGGVQPTREHTELEEELHEIAHIDYDRVAIIANASVAALYEDALVYEPGTAMTSTGALTAYSGAKTGRSPLDKRVVKEPGSDKDVWWGPVNKPMSPEVSSSAYFFWKHHAHPGILWESALQLQGLCDGWKSVHMPWESHPQHHHLSILPHLPKLVRGGFPAARCAEMFLVQRKNTTPQWLSGRSTMTQQFRLSSEGLGR